MKPVLMVAAVVTAGIVPLTAAQSVPRPSAVLAAAREAIGVRPSGPPLRSVRMEGTRMTTQAVQTDGRAGVVRSIDLEYSLVIEAVPPDQYVVTTSRGSRSRRETFNRGRGTFATKTLEFAEAPWEVRESSGALAETRQIDFARLALGVFARADVTSGAAIRDLGPTTVEIQASVGSRPFFARVDLDPATRLPARQTWRSRMQVYPPNSILGTIGETGGGAGAVGPSERPEIEVTMVFADHRVVNGFRLPFRITRLASGVVLTDMRLTTIEVNATPQD
jgi:hypothetical protein